MTLAKKALLAILLIPVIVVFIIAFAWDANWFKSDIESRLSDLEEHEIRFDRFGHSLLTPGKLTIHDIQVRGGIANGDIGSVSVDIDIMPALQKRILVKQVTLNDARVEVDMDKLQAYLDANRQLPPAEPEAPMEQLPVELLNVKSVLLRNISVKDVSGQQLFTLNGLNVEISDITAIEDFQITIMQPKIPANASFIVEEVLTKQVNIGKVSGNALVASDIIDVKSLSLESTNSKLALSGFVRHPKDNAEVHLAIADSVLDVADFAPLLGQLSVLPSGQFNISGTLDTQGALSSPKAMLQTLSGDMDLGLNDGALQGIDINKVVQAIKDSKKTSLRDIGGYLISGPIGLLSSNMFDLSGTRSAFDGTTEIPQLRLKSHFDNGKLQLKETAFSTDQHRLAFSGAVDLVNNSFQDFTFALLDENGCADVKQTLNGDMNKPASAVSKSLLDSALSPLNDIVGQVKKTLGKECTPFYQGDVAHPGTN